MNIRFFILSLFLLSTLTNCQSQSNHKCPFPYQNHHPKDNCGFIEVPRNWDRVDSGTTTIGYLVIASKSEQPKSDPVVFLQGGPGGNVLHLADTYSNLALDTDRDFILYDQRGIGFSEELCPNLNLQLLEVMAMDLEIKEEIKELQKCLSSCKNYLKTDSRQFSTTTSAKDLEALRKHLGYEELNLFGSSYGTRLGLKYMELYPKNTRSSVLSGLFPPGIRMYDNLFSSFNNSLNLVFESCENDTHCNTQYPNLKTEFLTIYASLRDHPIDIEINNKPYAINQQDVLLLLHQMLYNPSTIGEIPAFIEALKIRDDTVISATTNLFLPRLTLINLGVYYAIMTSDEGAFNNQDKLQLDSKNLSFSESGLSLFSADPEIIKTWPHKKIESNTMTFATSQIPTLLISGEFDPVTPPVNGNALMSSLPKSQHFVFKNNGHVPLNRCFFNLAKQFLDNPLQNVEASCTKTYNSFVWD